ncbi:MAG: HD domain-containing protein [Planctomycetota bacterium]
MSQDPTPAPPRDAIERCLGALLDLLALDGLPRTGWVVRGVRPPESVAGHSLGVAQVALALAPRVDPPLDLARVLAMAVIHDAPEAISGDIPRTATRLLPDGSKERLDASLADEVVAPLSDVALDAFREYEQRATREARFVKACDRLHLGVRLLGYERSGWAGLDEFGPTVAAEALAEFAPCAELGAALRQAREERA